MKKKFFIISLLFLLVGCSNRINLSNDYIVDISNKDSCNNEIIEYYSGNNQKVYTSCINKITLKDDKQSVELFDYLKQEDVKLEDTLNNVISKIIGKTSLLDGSTTLFQDGGTIKYTKNGYTVIACNTSNGNKDFYIATDSLQLKDNSISGFCGN